MAELQEMMTNEVLMKGRFISQFDLVNYAIERATRMIKSGINPRVRSNIGNRAYQILEEIAQKRDLLDDETSFSSCGNGAEVETTEKEVSLG